MAVDDAARGAVKLVKWLAGQADDIVPSADDIERFGPNAARVRSLLEFLPTMSSDARELSRRAWLASGKDFDEATLGIYRPRGVDIPINRIRQSNEASSEAYDVAMAVGTITAPAELAVRAESLAMPENASQYLSLTNPLAAGRAVDVLRTRPRLQNTRFLDIARQAAELGAVTRPRDIVAVSRIAQAGEDVEEIALALMADGMSAEQAMRTARMLAQ